jgi:hypothetical protein
LQALGADGALTLGSELARRRAEFPDLDYSAPPRPRRDDPLIPPRVRRRLQRKRRAGRARGAAEHLPPAVVKRLRAAKRRRDEPGSG